MLCNRVDCSYFYVGEFTPDGFCIIEEFKSFAEAFDYLHEHFSEFTAPFIREVHYFRVFDSSEGRGE